MQLQACNGTDLPSYHIEPCTGVSKMPGQTSRGSSHHNKEKIHINICVEISDFLSLIEILHSLINNNNNLPKSDILRLDIHIPNLITVEFLLFIKSRLAINAQNVLHMNRCTHEHI